jgi:hypothetical protein
VNAPTDAIGHRTHRTRRSMPWGAPPCVLWGPMGPMGPMPDAIDGADVSPGGEPGI